MPALIRTSAAHVTLIPRQATDVEHNRMAELDALIAAGKRDVQPIIHKAMSRKKPIKHGTRHAYQNRGCRCEDCRAANRDYRRARVARGR